MAIYWILAGALLELFVGTCPVLAAVLAAIDGQSVVWIRGNHDFEMNTQSLHAVGISVVNQWSCKIGDTVLGALHGDSSPDSAAVRLVRRAALGAPGRSLARVVGASRLLDLGHFASKASKNRHSENRLVAALTRQATLVDQQLASGWDICCVGHTHAPGLRESPHGLHVNLGDWSEHRTFAHVDDELRLLRWQDGETTPVEGPPRRRVEWGIRAF